MSREYQKMAFPEEEHSTIALSPLFFYHERKLPEGGECGGGGGTTHIKRTECSSYHLRVKKAVLVRVRVFSFKRSTAGTSSSRKKYDRRQCVVLKLVPLRGEKHFKLRPKYRISLPLRGSFQNFRRAPPSFLYGSPPPRGR